MAKQSALTAMASGSLFLFTFRTIRKVTWPSLHGMKRTEKGNLHQRVCIQRMNDQLKEKCAIVAVLANLLGLPRLGEITII